MRIQIDKFLRDYGLRTVGQLTRPKLHSVSKLSFPFNTNYHFMADNSAVIGPNQNDPIFKDMSGKLWIEHKLQITERLGNPRRTSVIAETLAAQFRRQNRFFKPLRKDESVKLNTTNVAVFNYAMLDQLWKYQANYKSSFFRWSNNAATFWTGVKEADERFKRNQFIEIHLPDTIPTFSQFKQLTKNQTQELIGLFNSPALLNLFDLYRYVGSDPDTSNIAKLSKEQIQRVNFFIRVKGSFFVFNLGLLDSWINHPDLLEETIALESMEPTEFYIDELGLEQYFVPNIMQRKLISLFTTLVEYNRGNEDLLETTQVLLEAEDPVIEDSTVDTEVVDDEVETAATTLAENTTITTFLDLDAIEVAYEPAPNTDLEPITLVIERDISDSPPEAPTLKVDDKVTKAVDLTETDQVETKAVVGRAADLVRAGAISVRTYEQALLDSTSFERLPDPFGSDQTIAEAMTYTPDDTNVPEETIVGNAVVEDTTSVLKGMTKGYVSKLLKKDILQSIMAVQQQGVSVTNVTMETVEDALNHYMIFTVTLKPIRGKSSQVTFRVPVIDENGRFRANNVDYRQRYQARDIPIRKVNPTTVALTSYYNKTFVSRSSRVDSDFDKWLVRSINLKKERGEITNVNYSEQDTSKFVLPRHYSALAKTFSDFIFEDYHFYWNHHKRSEYFLKHFELDITAIETGDFIVVGYLQSTQQILVMDRSNTIYLVEGLNKTPIDTIVGVLGLDLSKAPVEHIAVSVANKLIPIGFILAYRDGLTTLLEELKISFTTHPRRSKYELNPSEYNIIFNDEVLVLDRDDYGASLILAGLNRYKNVIKHFSRWDFDRKDVYYRILESSGLALSYAKEIDALYTAWVDPITKGLLEQMGEPTDFKGLLYRSVVLLTNDWSPNEVDGAYMRYCGYERMAGAVYNTMARAVKVYNNREGTAVQQVTMDHHEVWRKITQDPTVSTVEDSNPIANLREQEGFTFSGDGGRSRESMVGRTRIYGDADIGVVSEATVDSGDVGIIAYFSMNPNFTSLRGIARPADIENESMSSIFSSAMMLSPAAEQDDAKRKNFISIQQQQTIFTNGGQVPSVRSDFGTSVAQSVNSIFASAAIDNGVVTAINEHAITVTYQDGTVAYYPLGIKHGSAAGVTYPHLLVTTLKVGDKFKKGDTVSFNSHYFAIDQYTPGQAAWKNGVESIVAFVEDIETYEDGSTISEALAAKMKTQMTEVKNITVRFDQDITELLTVGSVVDLETVLCIIRDPEVSSDNSLGAASIETLLRMSSATPRAGVVGRISKIECYYHGDTDDMSDSARSIALTSDLNRKVQAEALGTKAFTGEVDSSFRVRGRVLEPDNMVIRVYIDQDVVMSSGDKLVAGHQMKSVVSRVMDGINETEFGESIDIIFGKTSIIERKVNSPPIIATTTLVLDVLSKHIYSLYKGETNAKAK